MTRTFHLTRSVKVALTLVCALIMVVFAQASGAGASTGVEGAGVGGTGVGGAGADAQSASMSAPSDGTATVGVEQCVTSTVQLERSATFTAQMTATNATQKMAMRIELQQRLHGESEFHALAAPGFGVWRFSEAGVKIYKYVKQVTNLDAPAAYRVFVRFRWIDEAGHVLKRDEQHTPRCLEPTLPGQVKQTPPTPTA